MTPTYLEHLTDAELKARLAKIEAMGKATAARLASGERSEAATIAVVRGRYADVSRLQVALNAQREAWKQTRTEIIRRSQEA